MDRTRLTVAMCTYNGARFLSEQLESIAAQTRVPDELVVCDDGSTDETVEIIKAFVERAPFAVRLEINRRNLGSTKNFEKAIGLCEGDIIALADQDDVWKPRKVATLEAALEEHPEAGYVFSDADLIDEGGALTGATLWKSVRFQGAILRSFSGSEQVKYLLRRSAVTGATMAFRSGLKKILSPIGSQFAHDYWISLLSSCIGSYGLPIPRRLILYRQHGGQQVGVPRGSILEKVRRARHVGAANFCNMTQWYRDMRERLKSATTEGKVYPAVNVHLLEEKIVHCSRREAAHSARGSARVGKIFSEVITGRYARFSDSWQSVVRDLCF